MKIALDWIARYLDAPVTAAEAQEVLLNAGLPVESVNRSGDTFVLDVEVTSNRTDCLSHLGLARELAALLGRKMIMPAVAMSENVGTTQGSIEITVKDAAACPYYSGQYMINVRVGPSPAWLKQLLESVGQRSINNVVDITNFVLLETGQPLHAFDADRLGGRRIVVRTAEQGETLVTIDGHKRNLQGGMLVIADGQSPVAVAGIMGGKDSQVTETTTNIFLESARFDPLSVRRTARALTLSSESSYRFERGIDPAAAEFAIRRAAAMIVEIAGGAVSGETKRAGKADSALREVGLRMAGLERMVGVIIPQTTVLGILSRLGYSPRMQGPEIVCQIPSYRLDISREIDLIEEVCRVWGYGNIPIHPQITHAVRPFDRAEDAGHLIRQVMACAGWHEAITFSFVDESEARLFLPEIEGLPARVSDAVRKVSNTLRPSILPGLLQARKRNENNGQVSARLFEDASIYFQAAGSPQAKPFEEHRLGLVGEGVGELVGALDLLTGKLNADAALNVVPGDALMFAPGTGGTLRIKIAGCPEVTVGTVGVFSLAVQEYYGLKHAAAGAELNWNKLLEIFEPVRKARAIPRFPAVKRDLSIVVDESIRWGDIQASLCEAGLKFLEKVEFVGVFRGKQAGPGKKSITLSMIFRNTDATLRSEDVDLQMKRALDVLQDRVAATLRV